MRKLLFCITLFFVYTTLNAQFTLNLVGIEEKTGKEVLLTEIQKSVDTWQARLESGGQALLVPLNTLKNFNFSPRTLSEFWQYQALSNEVYTSLTKSGPQYAMRKELENEALQFLSEMENNNLLFEDSFLENYLYSLVYKIYPGNLNDGRPGIVNVKIMKYSEPNAFIYSNGTLVISTGLLTTINSEEELIGVLAHEISHFVLDHSVININKSVQRQKRAEFWAAFATGLAAATEIYASTQDEYYIPGALTFSRALLSTTIAESVVERLNLKYSREQEFAADHCAVEIMKFIGVDPIALSSALQKIKNTCILNGNYFALSGEGSHPDLNLRINVIGKPKTFQSSTYDKLFSLVISSNAIDEYNSQHFASCAALVDRNINAGIALEDDYILKVMTNLCMYNNDEKNNENIVLLNKAKSLNVVPSINIYKQEGLALFRLNKFDESIASFQSYITKLEEEIAKTKDIKNESTWLMLYQYFESEIIWTKKMIYKIDNI